MNLTKPLCFIDLETTGTDIQKDRIVEICVLKVLPDGEEIKSTRINPEVSIPKGATDIHGITDEMVKDSPTFKQISKSLLSFIQDCDYAGFNSTRFDYPFLFNEFNRAGLFWDYTGSRFVDVRNIYTIREERTLASAVKFYLNKDHSDAHGAEADVKATHEVFKSMFERYEDLPTDMKQLQEYSNFGKPLLDLNGNFTQNEHGEIIFNFSKHKGAVASTERGFLFWMLKQDFPADTIAIVKKILFSNWKNFI